MNNFPQHYLNMFQVFVLPGLKKDTFSIIIY